MIKNMLITLLILVQAFYLMALSKDNLADIISATAHEVAMVSFDWGQICASQKIPKYKSGQDYADRVFPVRGY